MNNKPVNVWGDYQVRDYIHIDDAISGIMAVLNYDGSEHIFNVGSGIGTTVNEVIKIAENELHEKAIIKHYPARKCDVSKNIHDISKIKRETNWEPTITLSEGIRKIIKAKESKNEEPR